MNPEAESERDRSRRGDRPSRFSDTKNKKDQKAHEKRIYVSNIPYEYDWKEVKDLFREHVGDVSFVELFSDEKDRPRGCGVIEFSTKDSVKKAMEVMHRFPIEGRKLVIKEDYGYERDKYGHVINDGSRDDLDKSNERARVADNWSRGNNAQSNNISSENYNTYGLSAQFLESIGVHGPLLNRVFVANLEFKVDKAKLKEVFKMAGKVRNIELSTDKEGNSRGMAVIEYDHPVEAVQAISMFDKQTLYDRKMAVRMDKLRPEKSENRLPEGLKGIGLGLGTNGEPLHDVARHIAQSSMGGTGAGVPGQQAGILGAVPSAGLSLGNVTPAFGNSSLGANNLNNNLSLQALGLGNLGTLQSQLLQQGLAENLAISAGSSGGMNSMTNLGGGMQEMNSGSQMPNGLIGNGFNRNMGMNQNSGHFSMQSNVGRQTGGSTGFFNQQGLDSISSPLPLFNSTRNNDDMQFGNQNKTMDTIHISNLPSSMTWQLLREKFSEAGEVKFADKIGKDTALVRFQNEWSASRAIKAFDRTRIDGRTIDVRFY